MPTHYFSLGNVNVSTNNINELREYVAEISAKLAPGAEYGKHINDFIFDVEAEYQRFHDLDPDDWSMVHPGAADFEEGD